MRSSAGLLALALLVLSGCSPAPAEENPGAAENQADQQISVFAAASLDEALRTVARDYEEDSGVSVLLSSAGSADLLAQLEQGAPADVFIPADLQTMQRAESGDLIAAPAQPIASNTLVIAVPAGNPAQIDSIQDLDAGSAGSSASPSTGSSPSLVMCADQVPCGALAQQVAEAADITLSPVSEELAVTDVLGKVRSGEADAGLVYSTDALRAADQVDAVEIPEAAEFPNRYPAAVLRDSPQPELAQDFLDFLSSAPGQEALNEAGFGPGSEPEDQP